ncbi:hypothetical protein SanaruYs_37390 [Chryseotalea sanaruensis]|uniref:Uncharacterized protein n=1 Tax=Chryseotalea sanaruensis TaxID=2482724 RepID=A0A401UF67_9BACT|nr:hypothetical protein [Chryseotalea sanaruensis]GCC53494.1 hypothetical protein SanaruYs_37390 [Chryseotalea sanaruensis]
MIRLFVVFTVILILFACSREKTKVNDLNKIEQLSSTDKILEKSEPVRESILETELTEEQRKLVILYSTLYNELIEFKDSDKFKQFGFSKQGYSIWLEKVSEQMDKQRTSESLRDFSIEKEIFFGDLHMLGLDYVFSEGKETKQTKDGMEKIYRVLNPVTISKESSPFEKGEY